MYLMHNDYADQMENDLSDFTYTKFYYTEVRSAQYILTSPMLCCVKSPFHSDRNDNLLKRSLSSNRSSFHTNHFPAVL